MTSLSDRVHAISIEEILSFSSVGFQCTDLSIISNEILFFSTISTSNFLSLENKLVLQRKISDNAVRIHFILDIYKTIEYNNHDFPVEHYLLKVLSFRVESLY